MTMLYTLLVVSCTLTVLMILYFWVDRAARKRSREYRTLADKADIDGVPFRLFALTFFVIGDVVLSIVLSNYH